MAALIGLVKLGPQTPFSGGFTVGADEGEGVDVDVDVGVGADDGRSARWTAGPDPEGVISWAIDSLESVAAAPCMNRSATATASCSAGSLEGASSRCSGTRLEV